MASEPHDEPVPGLSECDREPIHVPGQIQTFGYLFACCEKNWTVSHVSANAALGAPPASLLGKTAKDVLGIEVFHELRNALSTSSGPGLPGRVYELEMAHGGRWNVSAHAFNGHVIFECEPAPRAPKAGTLLFVIRSLLARMQQAHSINDICQIAVRQLRSLIDFDRVMIYRFLQDGSGSVIAECAVDDAPSFLGHHYPASDIPQQARQLYMKNWLRLISDVHASPVPVLASGAEVAPLDMTYCALRSVSPIHIQYLKNMNVGASLSISIVVGGELWGLIACHNSVPRVVPLDTRLAAEFFGQAFSLQLQTLARADVAELLRDAREKIDWIVSNLVPGVPLWESLGPRLADVQRALDCDGAALWFDGRLVLSGTCPPEDEVPRIAEALTAAGHHDVFTTHQLCLLHPAAVAYSELASGLMAVPLSRTPGHYLLLFRREFIRTIEWAGNPDKPVQRDAETLRLSPRHSFELWREEVKNQSRIWEPRDRLVGEALRTALLEIVLKHSEIVSLERAKSARQQRLQSVEFNHRIKNALTLVDALVALSRDQHEDMSSFAADLQGRIRSLAVAHDLASRLGRLDLAQLFAIELAPYRDAGRRIDIDGPAVLLTEDTSRVMALIVHELATNACKYGALSVPSGTVRVRWHIDVAGHCAIDWRERDGPPMTEPTTTGFGMLLVKRQIPFELGGEADVRFAPEGLEITLSLPPESFSLSNEAVPDTAGSIEAAPPPGVLEGRCVLLVEDNLIAALDVERRLERLGAKEVYVVGSLAPALRCATTLPIDVALLDVNLKGATSYSIAEVLARRNIPFIFSTGYGPDLARPDQFSSTPLIGKPHTDAGLADVMAAVLKARQP